MEKRLQTILDSLLPEAPRSRLEPYRELILRLRRDGRSYRRIVALLDEKCSIRVTPSTLHEFVQRRSRPRKPEPVLDSATTAHIEFPETKEEVKPASRSVPEKPAQSGKMSREEYAAQLARMQALKAQPVAVPEKKKLYEYDPDKPLTLIQRNKE